MRWQDVLAAAGPKYTDGMFNPKRKDLIEPGVFVDLSPLTAAAKMPSVKEKLKEMGIPTTIPVADETKPKLEALGPVRMTVLELDEDTITVEAMGVRDRISASLLSNLIKGPDTCPQVIVSNGRAGWAPLDTFRGNVG